MKSLSRVMHVLSLGLWFGSMVFFTLIVAPVIFATFKQYSEGNVPENRSAFFVTMLQGERGSELAGIAVGPIFPYYYLLQGICGLLVLFTSFRWLRQFKEPVHRWRFYFALLAFITVLIGWPLANYVSELRAARYGLAPDAAAAAKSAFATWHLVSLGLNCISMGLVAGALTLATWLPQDQANDTQAARPS